MNELAKSSDLTYKKVEDYLNLLEQMYIVKKLEPKQSILKKTITKMRKLYFFDAGMRNVIYGSFNGIDIRVDNGTILENFVMLELLKCKTNSTRLNFCRTKDGMEIDFVMDDMLSKATFGVKFKDLDKKVALR